MQWEVTRARFCLETLSQAGIRRLMPDASAAKVAKLRERIATLKTKLAHAKGQRDAARSQRNEALETVQELLKSKEDLHLQKARCLQELEQSRGRMQPWEDNPVLMNYLHMGWPSYQGDAMVAWMRTMDFLEEDKFKRAYQRGMDSGFKRGPWDSYDIHIEWRIHFALWAASHAARLEGDFVECGVSTGIRSIAICDYLDFNRLDKDFYLFDTYCGIPEGQMSSQEREDRVRDNALLYEECYETALRNFAPWPRCHLVRGTVPDTLTSATITKVAYLHIDMNIALPEKAALEFFWDKMTPGGVILLDDYGSSYHRAQYDVANEFAAQRGVKIATLPTAQGLLLKS